MRALIISLAFALVLAAGVSTVRADDWTAARLRGTVVQLVQGNWQPIHRNDVVPDETVIRTLANGYADFTRGAETVSLSPDTQIQIFDKGGAKPFTTVKQAFGTVAVEAEVQNVQHFAVQTPYLAAVVKGTKFTVVSGKTGASVNVRRGHVEVDNPSDHTHTTISIGQSARTGLDTGGQLEVAGAGNLPPVLDAHGKPVGPAGLADNAARLAAEAKAAAALAKQLGTPEAKAAAEAARKAADAANKLADAAEKAADKAASEVDKLVGKLTKDADRHGGNEGPGGGKGKSTPPAKTEDSDSGGGHGHGKSKGKH